MRVAVVNKLLVPAGSARWSTGWSLGLKELGHEVTTVFIREAASASRITGLLKNQPYTSYLTGAKARLSELVGLPAVQWWMQGAFDRDSSPDPISWALAPIIGSWKGKYDLLLAHDEYTGLGCLIAHKLYGTPYVVNFAEAIADVEPYPLRSPLRVLRAEVGGNAILRVANSSRVAQSYVKAFGFPVEVIPTGCTPAANVNVEKHHYILADTRWTTWRDPFFLLDVAERAHAIEFVLAGTFASMELERQWNDEVRRRGLTNRIRRAVSPDEPALISLYRNALAYVRWAARAPGLPPESGVPSGIFQSLSQGCPFIIDDSISVEPTIRSRFQKWIVPFNADSFAQAILTLATDPALARTVAALAWTTSKELSWTARAADLIQKVKTKIGGNPAV